MQVEELIKELVSKHLNESNEPTTQDVFEAGKTYLILGSNNKFLSIINYGGNDYIDSKKNQQDVFCCFVASTLYNGKIALTSIARKMYLHQVHGECIRTIPGDLSPAAQFEVEVGSPASGPWPGARYVYLKAANGKYWGIAGGDKIMAAFDTKEIATCLIVLRAE